MQKLVRLAHISDVHLPNVAGFSPRHLNLKRGLGFINWQRKRRFIHLQSTVDLLLEDLRQQEFDHLAVSGDLANLGLPSELEAAATWLKQLGNPSDVSVIPGNHDIYCPLSSDQGTERWQDYMSNIPDVARQAGPSSASGFPYVRRLGDVALIGVNSAVPTPPGIASGQVGMEQLERLQMILFELAEEGCFRLVMIHHPPLPGQASKRRALKDAADLQSLIADAGAELIIHGHNHRSMLAHVDGASGAIPVVGVPSFSATYGPKSGELAAYNIYEISKIPSGYSIALEQRGLKRDAEGVMCLRREKISGVMHKQN